jgi:hypothetical protein
MLPAFFSRRKPVFGGYYWRQNKSQNFDDQQQTNNGIDVESEAETTADLYTASITIPNQLISSEHENTSIVDDTQHHRLSADEAFTEEVYQNAINSILSNCEKEDGEYNDNDQDYDIVEKRDCEEEPQNAVTEEEPQQLQNAHPDPEESCERATIGPDEVDIQQSNTSTATSPVSIVNDAEVTSILEKDSAEPITSPSPTLPSSIAEVNSIPPKSTKTGAKKQKQKKKKSTRAD